MCVPCLNLTKVVVIKHCWQMLENHSPMGLMFNQWCKPMLKPCLIKKTTNKWFEQGNTNESECEIRWLEHVPCFIHKTLKFWTCPMKLVWDIK